ncbi:hypothetical protein [Lactobacillus crispatus]|nr:hypothetical protein [Lactobacillus crispatus]
MQVALLSLPTFDKINFEKEGINMIETIRAERVLLKKLAKYKSLNHNDPIITKDPYLIKDLVDKGLVQIYPVNKVKNHITNMVDFNYSLSPEGEHYFQERHEQFRKFLLRSVLVPIIVSVITTLLTTQLIPFILHTMLPK